MGRSRVGRMMSGLALVAGLVLVAGILVGAAPLNGNAAAASARGLRSKADPVSDATYTNPVFNHPFPDPDVFRDPRTGIYYAYATTDQWGKASSSIHIIPILESTDLTHWKFLHDAFLPPGSKPTAYANPQPAWTQGPSGSMWAPEVHFIDGRYVMYYNANNSVFPGSAIGVATATSPAGPWVDSGGPLVGPRFDGSGSAYWTFDPHEMRAASGQRYLYYGSFYGGVWVTELTPNGLHVVPGFTPVEVGGPGLYEGTDVVRHGGYYYLFASSGNCCALQNTAYTTMMGRSRSPIGPFLDKEGVPMTQGGGSVFLGANGNIWSGSGGGTIFQDADHQDWIVFFSVNAQHPFEPSGFTQRLLMLEPVEWSPSGWPEANCGLGPETGPQPAPRTKDNPGPPTSTYASCPAQLPPLIGHLMPQYSQTFDTTTLGKQWSWVNENTSDWSLTSEPGTLTIDSQVGGIYGTQDNAVNILLEQAPKGSFAIQTKFDMQLNATYAQGGLLIYQQNALHPDFVELLKDYNGDDASVDVPSGSVVAWVKQTNVTDPYESFNCGAPFPVHTCAEPGNTFLGVPGGTFQAAHAGGSATWTWLRIVKLGNRVTAYTSLNGRTWIKGTTFNLNGFNLARPLSIGVYANAPNDGTSVPAHFAYVKVFHVGVRG